MGNLLNGGLLTGSGVSSGSGGGGLVLGQAQNTFTGANKEAAETARDAYAAANEAWLASYDENPTAAILLTYGGTETFQARSNDAWHDVSPIVQGRHGTHGDPGPQGEQGEQGPPGPEGPIGDGEEPTLARYLIDVSQQFASAAGTWRSLTFNATPTQTQNNITGHISAASNLFTLQPGTYNVTVEVTVANTDDNRRALAMRLYANDNTLLANYPDTTYYRCLLYTSPSPRDRQKSRMPSSA